MSEFRTPYPTYEVLDKWDSPSWNDQTRETVRKRLEEVPPRRFLEEEQWALLEAIVARLIPQPEREEPVPIVPWIDDRLSKDRRHGYRYADMPPMRQAWTSALDAIAAECADRFATTFQRLSAKDQDAYLGDLQKGAVDARFWGDLPVQCFFSELLLKDCLEIYYSNPAAWSEIGFGGPASPRGYVRLGFDERDPWEGEELDV
jgi:Gluconate 2-dehydrogenase subunit 3